MIQKGSRCAAADRTFKTTLFIFHFLYTQRSYEKTICIYFIGSVVSIIFLFALHKERQTSKELKRNMNDGTIVFLTPLHIVLT